MVADALSGLRPEVMDDRDFDKDLLDRYDERLATITRDVKETYDNKHDLN